MSRTDDLATTAAEARAARERRTAVAAAVRDFARTGGGGAPPEGLLRALAARLDGTAATLRDGTRPARNVAGDTNHADDITH